MRKAILVLTLVLILALGLTSSNCPAVQFDASVPPRGAFYLKMYPRFFVTSAKFDDLGRPINFSHLSTLTYVDTPLELYCGITDSLMAGILLPVGYIRRNYVSGEISSATQIGNPWLIVKHQFWSEVLYAASSLRVKLPITEIEPLEEGFDIDDKQIDIYPVYYIDWQMPLGTYIYGQIGYKYRMKSGKIKPSDEMRIVVETGYAVVPDIIRIFTFSDFTKFFGGEINGEVDRSSVGYLYTIGAGVRFFLRRNLRVEIFTSADPYGRNRFRGIGGCAGIGCVFGM
jgi:hypothetical protein